MAPLYSAFPLDNRNSTSWSKWEMINFFSQLEFVRKLLADGSLTGIAVVRRSKEKNVVIFSDSMSSLQSIYGFNLDSDLVQKFLKDYTILEKKWQEVWNCCACVDVPLRNYTLTPLGLRIGPACEAGLSAGMRRERVSPQIRKKEKER